MTKRITKIRNVDVPKPEMTVVVHSAVDQRKSMPHAGSSIAGTQVANGEIVASFSI